MTQQYYDSAFGEGVLSERGHVVVALRSRIAAVQGRINHGSITSDSGGYLIRHLENLISEIENALHVPDQPAPPP